MSLYLSKKKDLSEVHREADEPVRSRNTNFLSVFDWVDKKVIQSSAVEFWPKGKLKT